MNEHDATEQAFKNGANYMKTITLALLSDLKSTAMGPERFTITTIMEQIQKLEVRT